MLATFLLFHVLKTGFQITFLKNVSANKKRQVLLLDVNRYYEWLILQIVSLLFY